MKIILTTAAFLALLGWMPMTSHAGESDAADSSSMADHAGHHPPHKMFMYGENEVFASHIVYTKPHNYQVILRLHLDSAVQARYSSERRLHPNDDFIYLLDAMDIGAIRSAESLAGTVFRKDADGRSFDLFPLELAHDRYELVYFSELTFIP